MMVAPPARALLGALLAAAVATALPAGAQTLRPGLWETSSVLSSADPQTQAGLSQMQKHLAGLTPEQRESMQQMLKRNGVELDLGANGALRTRMCLTREMIARREIPLQKGKCAQQATQVSPTQVKVAFQCTQPAASGEGDVIVDDERHYHGRIHAVTGNNQNADADVTGTWIAASCAAAKPAR